MGLLNVYKIQNIINPFMPYKFTAEIWTFNDIEPDPKNYIKYDVKSVRLPVYNLNTEHKRYFGNTQFNIPIINFNELELSITFIENEEMGVFNYFTNSMGFLPFESSNVATFKIRIKQFSNDIASQCVDEKVYLCRLKNISEPSYTTSPGEIAEVTVNFYVMQVYANANAANNVKFDDAGALVIENIEEIDHTDEIKKAAEAQKKIRLNSNGRFISDGDPLGPSYSIGALNAAYNNDMIHRLTERASDVLAVTPKVVQDNIKQRIVDAFIKKYDYDKAFKNVSDESKDAIDKLKRGETLTSEEYASLFLDLNPDKDDINELIFAAFVGDISDGIDADEANNLATFIGYSLYESSATDDTPLNEGDDVINLLKINYKADSKEAVEAQIKQATQNVILDLNDTLNEYDSNIGVGLGSGTFPPTRNANGDIITPELTGNVNDDLRALHDYAHESGLGNNMNNKTDTADRWIKRFNEDVNAGRIKDPQAAICQLRDTIERANETNRRLEEQGSNYRIGFAGASDTYGAMMGEHGDTSNHVSIHGGTKGDFKAYDVRTGTYANLDDDKIKKEVGNDVSDTNLWGTVVFERGQNGWWVDADTKGGVNKDRRQNNPIKGDIQGDWSRTGGVNGNAMQSRGSRTFYAYDTRNKKGRYV